jgi:hypothetical protein
MFSRDIEVTVRTPLNVPTASSIIFDTCVSTSLAPALGYTVDITIIGISISGVSSCGMEISAIAPKTIIALIIIIAAIGLPTIVCVSFII